MKLAEIIEGMQIIAKHSPDQYCVQAEHDEIFCGDAALPLSDAEKARMKELGWIESDGSWSCFT